MEAEPSEGACSEAEVLDDVHPDSREPPCISLGAPKFPRRRDYEQWEANKQCRTVSPEASLFRIPQPASKRQSFRKGAQLTQVIRFQSGLCLPLNNASVLFLLG